MQEKFKGLIAVMLLGIYVFLVYAAIKVVYCAPNASCTFTDSMAQALSVVGGLVSALVVAVLAITKPGEMLLEESLPRNASKAVRSFVAIASTAYVLVWLCTGLTAFMIGLYHPEKVPQLTTLGQAWLGLAVSAAYSYFGLHPTGRGL